MVRSKIRTAAVAGIALIVGFGCYRAVESFRRAPMDEVWPARHDPDVQPALRAEVEGPEDELPVVLADLPSRPGLWVNEGELEGFRFLEVVVGDVEPDASLPLLVALHGRGDRPRVPGAPFSELGRPVRVVLPAAPERLGPGFAWFPVRVLLGQTDPRQSEALAQSARRMGHRMSRFLRTYMEERPTVGRPLVSGFSQGGVLTFVLAVRHADLFEAAYPLATWMPGQLLPTEEQEARYPPIRSMHGRDDAVIPIGPTRLLVDGLRARGVAVQFEEFDGVAHYMSREMTMLHQSWMRDALDAMMARFEPPPSEDGGSEDAGFGDGDASVPPADVAPAAEDPPAPTL